MNLEHVIFSNLIDNEEYFRKVIAFIKPDYFASLVDKTVFELITEYAAKYNKFPTKEALQIDLSNKTGLNELNVKECSKIIDSLQRDPGTDTQWLIDQTEKFCQDKAIYNGIMDSIDILNEKDGALSKGSIPQILTDALAVSFDTAIGTDFLEDSNKLFEHLHTKEVLIPFDLEYFNKITGGGLSRKTLNVILAGTNVGKSMFMCHMASACLSMGYNVLYITMEMSEEKIQKRIAANLYDVPLDDLKLIARSQFEAKVKKFRERSKGGKLIIKEYPTTCAGAAHFRHLFNELKLKKNFKPDIVFIDYLNICMSTRIRHGSNVNSYTYIKSIAEELRGLAVEFNLPLVTATQTTRTGHSNTDLSLEDTSESFGLPATADFMIGLSTSEELEQLGQIMVKQLKARDHDKKLIKRFVIGVDYSKMRLYDVEQQAQNIQDGPVMDRTDFGQQDYERQKPKFDKKKFAGFK